MCHCKDLSYFLNAKQIQSTVYFILFYFFQSMPEIYGCVWAAFDVVTLNRSTEIFNKL